MKSLTSNVLAILAAGTLAACGDSTKPAESGQLNFSLASRSASGAPAPAFLVPDTISVGADVLVIEKVEIVIKEIEFQREDDECDVQLEEEGESEDHACEEFRTGPVLVDLPLGVGAEHKFSVAVDTGTYSSLQFKVHPPQGDDAEDAAFIAAHPEFDGVSIRVTGTWNGIAFTYITDLDADQEIEFTTPLVVNDNTSIDLTLFVDVRSWFLTGGVLIDPALAVSGGQFEGVVKNNIEGSFDAFEDEDDDGEED